MVLNDFAIIIILKTEQVISINKNYSLKAYDLCLQSNKSSGVYLFKTKRTFKGNEIQFIVEDYELKSVFVMEYFMHSKMSFI